MFSIDIQFIIYFCSKKQKTGKTTPSKSRTLGMNMFNLMHNMSEYFQLLVLDRMKTVYISTSEIGCDVEFYVKFSVRAHTLSIYMYTRTSCILNTFIDSPRNLLNLFCQDCMERVGRPNLNLGLTHVQLLLHLSAALPMSFFIPTCNLSWFLSSKSCV